MNEVLLHNPFKQTRREVIGLSNLQSQGLGLHGVEVHSAGSATNRWIAIGTLNRQPLSLLILIEDTP